MVLRMSTWAVQLHRLNTLTTSVTLHVSRVVALGTFVAHVESLVFVARPLPDIGSRAVSFFFNTNVSVFCGEEKMRFCHPLRTSAHAQQRHGLVVTD